MNKPIIKDMAGGYTLKWAEGITITCSRLRDYRDDIYSEIRIECKLDGYIPVLEPCAKYYLLSRTGRKDMAKTLSAACKDINWAEVLQELSNAVVPKFRAGKPVEELWSSGELVPMEYLLYPILPKNDPTIIYGDSGVGKSYIALLLAVAVMLPWDKNPFGFKCNSHSAPVLYLDWEAGSERTRRRIQLLKRGLNLPDFPIQYRYCERPLSEEIPEISELIEKYKTRLVVVDSISGACEGDLNKAEIATSFINRHLRKWQTTCLLIGHTGKDLTRPDSVIGSSLWKAGARSQWVLKKTQQVGDSVIEVGLYHRKANDSMLFNPKGFKMWFAEDSTRIEPIDPKTISGLEGETPLRNRILDLLLTGSHSLTEIAEALEEPKAQVAVRLSELKKSNKVKKLDEYRWGVLTDEFTG